MIIRYTDHAIADLEAIADYLVRRSPLGALKVRAAIEAAIKQLERFPRLGTQQSEAGVRKLVISRYPYLVFYWPISTWMKCACSQFSTRRKNASTMTLKGSYPFGFYRKRTC